MSNINTWPGWESVRTLGSGAFGKVYEIQKEESGKIYKAALKVISIPQDEADIESAYSEGLTKEEITSYFKSFVNNITNEFALMSDLKGYTNIVSYEDHMVVEREGSIGWDILIRMELLTPLHKWIVNHPMDEKEIIRLGCDICRALELCQKNKIIHRDIKPENIFVNKNGDFKLGDFGIARVVEKTSNVMSQQRGTYTYMAPEVFKGQYYNQTADIYSLGVVLYRFLNNNRAPFLPQGTLLPTDREKAQERRMSGEQIPAPVNGSEKLKQAVLMAIEYDPNKRMQNAQAFRMILEQCGNKTEREWVQSKPEPAPVPESVPLPEPVPIPEPEDDSTRRTPVKIPTASKKKKKWILPVGIVMVIIAIILNVASVDDNNTVPSEIPATKTTNKDAEHTSVDNDYNNQSSVESDNITLDEYSIILNEASEEPVVWKLPVALDEFAKKGWSADASLDSYVSPGNSTAMLKKNNSSCMVFLRNDSSSEKRLRDCEVVGVVVYSAMNTYLEIKGNINLDSSIEELETIYGKASELYKEDGYVFAMFQDKRLHFMTGYEKAMLYLLPGHSYEENFFYDIHEAANNEGEKEEDLYISVVLRKHYEDPSYNDCWKNFYDVCIQRGIYCEIYWPDSPENIAQQVAKTELIVDSHECDVLFLEAPDEYSMKDIIDIARAKGISVIGLNDYMKNTDTNINNSNNWGSDEWNGIFDLVSVQEKEKYDVTEGGIHSYEVIIDDCSWDEAYQNALNMGGYLVRINSEEEYEYITSMLEGDEYQEILFRLGARRDSDSTEYYWIDENNKCYGERLNDSDYWTNSQWKSGEPNFSYEEDEEICVEMHRNAGGTSWVWNDIPNDVVEEAPYYKGRVGFIVEYE